MEDRDFTTYRRLQAHAAFTFGTVANGDVPKIML
jgi:hypothetical protein